MSSAKNRLYLSADSGGHQNISFWQAVAEWDAEDVSNSSLSVASKSSVDKGRVAEYNSKCSKELVEAFHLLVTFHFIICMDTFEIAPIRSQKWISSRFPVQIMSRRFQMMV